MCVKPTILIFGAGPRNGAAIVEAFSKGGYNVATVSRKGTGSINEQGHLSLQADFSDPSPTVIAGLFDTVEAQFNTPPSVVVYNAASMTPPADKDSALSIPAARVTVDLNVNVVTPFVVAQEAVKRWSAGTDSGKKLFIYTGNAMNELVIPVPLMMNLGVGKAASAYWIGVADASYSAKGYRFIYADQRQADGSFSGAALDGPAHGAFYSQLAASKAEDIPWHATFVKDKGYVKF